MIVSEVVSGINVANVFKKLKESDQRLQELSDTYASIDGEKQEGAYKGDWQLYLSELSALRTLYIELRESLINTKSNLYILKMSRNDAARSAYRHKLEWQVKEGKFEDYKNPSWRNAERISYLLKEYEDFMEEQNYFYGALAKVEGILECIDERLNDIAMKVSLEKRFLFNQNDVNG